jgi:hypothetical protein
MGLLDDAIRQHLELKRRHGADPGDVARLEHEALGPVQREDALAVPAPEDVPAASTALDDDQHVADAAVAHEEEVAFEEAELEADERWEVTHPPAAPEPAAADPVEPPATEPGAGGSVRAEPSPPHAHEPDPQPDLEPGEHDELEETPEFLQETPEHDRLWFEQKPPRDFDF